MDRKPPQISEIKSTQYNIKQIEARLTELLKKTQSVIKKPPQINTEQIEARLTKLLKKTQSVVKNPRSVVKKPPQISEIKSTQYNTKQIEARLTELLKKTQSVVKNPRSVAENPRSVAEKQKQRVGSQLNDDERDNLYNKPTFYLTICNDGSDEIGYYVDKTKFLYTNQCILISIMDHLKLLGRLDVNYSIAQFREENGIHNKLWDPHKDFQFANNNDQTTLLINIMINHKLRLKFVVPYYNETDRTLIWTTNPVVDYPDYTDSDCDYAVSNVYILNTPRHFALLINGFNENRYTPNMVNHLIQNKRDICNYYIDDVIKIQTENRIRATKDINQFKKDINQFKKEHPEEYLRSKIKELTENIELYGLTNSRVVADMQNTINDMEHAIKQNTAEHYIKRNITNKYLKYKQKYLHLKTY